ncbi:MAG TPA: glycosyltransferase family 4 protein [Bryobacteraceae bacterium]|nr:glycosyltransferase family 4 protein [Bryobacteraceae bacterium]
MATESLAPGNGGICRVARLMARVLGAEAAAGRVRLEALAFRDPMIDPSLNLSGLGCNGSHLRYVLRVQRALWRNTHVIYDMAGMARAHRALRWFGKPMACWMHGIEIWERARTDRISWCRNADLLLANSNYTRRRAQRLHRGLDHAKVCWLATEDDALPGVLPRQPAPNVMILGRIDSIQKKDMCYKGHESLIDCWPEVLRAIPEARLTIVGGGSGRSELEQHARSTPAAGAVDFLGFVPDEALPAVFARSSVFAMPSRGEGFGLVYIEAMRHGLPVIASEQDAASEVNLHGISGFNVNLDRREELPNRIIELLRDPALAMRMGDAGRQRWAENFRFSAFRDRFLGILYPWLAGGALHRE